MDLYPSGYKTMNERIRELAEQAMNMVPDDAPSIAHGLAVFNEKFAELIVRECIAVVKPTQHHEVWAQSYLGGVDGLDLLYSKVKEIKQHFGVEHE
jgi:hypothetical protein